MLVLTRGRLICPSLPLWPLWCVFPRSRSCRGLSSAPQRGELLTNAAHVRLRLGDAMGAARSYDAALRGAAPHGTDPTALPRGSQARELEPSMTSWRAAALTGLGLAKVQLGDTAGALAAHRAAVMTDPRDVSALTNLGSALITAGDAESAAQALRQVGLHGSLTVHSLFTHCSLTAHSLSTHCSLTVHSLFTHCSLTVRTLFTHCALTVHSLLTH